MDKKTVKSGQIISREKPSEFLVDIYKNLSFDDSKLIFTIEIKKNIKKHEFNLKLSYIDIDGRYYDCEIFDDKTAKIFLVNEDGEVGPGISFENYKMVIDRIQSILSKRVINLN